MKEEDSAQINGNMTIIGSRNLSEEVKRLLLEAPEGQTAVISKTLIDPETKEEVVIEGELYLSKNKEPINRRSLTAVINFKVKNVQRFLRSVKIDTKSVSLIDQF